MFFHSFSKNHHIQNQLKRLKINFIHSLTTNLLICGKTLDNRGKPMANLWLFVANFTPKFNAQ